MKAVVSKGLMALFTLAMPIVLSGCSGCEDIRLIRTCSHKSVSKAPCLGQPDNYTLYEYNPDDYNVGVCRIGTIQCRRDITTVEEYCPEGGDQCFAEWESAQFDDVCIGNISPKVEECGNDIDEDCDGVTNEGYDIDQDGYQDANQFDSLGRKCGFDCDDTDPDVHPGAVEICDGKDNNCNCWNSSERDTNSDQELCGCNPDPDCVSYDRTLADGVTIDWSVRCCDKNVDEMPTGAPISNLGICHPDIPEEINLDDLVFQDTPCEYSVGKLTCRHGVIECEGAEFVGPEPEMCDGIDNNCNGWADEPGAVVGEGDACGSDVGVCEPGYMICNPVTSDMVCIDEVGGTHPDMCDGLDNDCDNSVDEDAEDIVCHNGCPQYGFMYCVGGGYSVCDAPGPVSEDEDPCNGIDDDCDGLVDEGQECQCDPNEIGPNAPVCTTAESMGSNPPLTCGQGRKDCECENGDCQYGECYLACDPWVNGVPVDNPNTWYLPCPEEQCDAWDHNCWGNPPDEHIDGLIDIPCACDPNSAVPAIAQAAQNGNCEEGLCTAGEQTCEFDNQMQQWRMMPDDCGAVGPEEEVCDELDNDCDGDVDEDLNAFDKVDMVFAIDITGSMGDEIQAIHDSLSVYAQDFMQTEHRFALMLFPAPHSMQWTQVGSPAQSCGPYGGGQAYWTMTGGLVDVQTFLGALQTVLNTGLACGNEPSYDVLAALTSVQDPAGIGWRPDAYPYVFILGDEMAQTWTNLTENDIAGPAETCDGIGGCPCLPGGQLDCPVPVNEFEVHCFVSPQYNHQYDDICYNDVVGDNVYDVNSITANLLRDIFADVCLPDEQNQQGQP